MDMVDLHELQLQYPKLLLIFFIVNSSKIIPILKTFYLWVVLLNFEELYLI